MNFEYLKTYMDSLTQWIIPGNAIVVYKDGKKVFSYQSGFSNLEKQIPVTGEELLNIYSCSKIATVTSALQLFEQGKFLLSDPLSDYMPQFRTMYVRDENGTVTKAKNQITLQNLFTMTAGFTYDFDLPSFAKARELTHEKMNTRTVIECLAEEPLAFEPGTHWRYSVCHDVLAAFVEVVSGQKFRDYVQKNIFDKLDMKQSYYHVPASLESHMSEQYHFKVTDTQDIVELQKNRAFVGGTVVNAGKKVAHILGDEYDSGGAGITTTVDDYARFLAALANDGIGINGERILSSATVELMKRNQLTPQQMKDFNWKQLAGYGYGLGVRTMVDCAIAGSNGNVGEFGWGGAAGATALIDTECNLALFYAHHMLNPQEEYYQPRLRNVVYSCITR